MVIIFYNGSYLFSNANIGGLSYFFVYRLPMVLFDRSEGMGRTPSSFFFTLSELYMWELYSNKECWLSAFIFGERGHINTSVRIENAFET